MAVEGWTKSFKYIFWTLNAKILQCKMWQFFLLFLAIHSVMMSQFNESSCSSRESLDYCLHILSLYSVQKHWKSLFLLSSLDKANYLSQTCLCRFFSPESGKPWCTYFYKILLVEVNAKKWLLNFTRVSQPHQKLVIATIAMIMGIFFTKFIDWQGNKRALVRASQKSSQSRE